MTALDVAPEALGRSVMRVERQTLGMAELGLRGLSEHWLLRRLGDLHWRLIAEALGEADAVFATPDGRPVYAAFCAISLHAPGMALPRAGDALRIAAQLFMVSRSRQASVHRLELANRAVGVVTMMSTFVAHGRAGDNQSIARVALRDLGDLPQLPAIHPLPRVAADLASGRAREHLGLAALPTDRARLIDRARPCPATDFNAAGLLYFPNYVALADRAEWAAFPRIAANPVTLRRDVIYSGNIDRGEVVEAHLLDSAAGPDGFRHAILLRTPEGKPLCRAFTHRAAG